LPPLVTQVESALAWASVSVISPSTTTSYRASVLAETSAIGTFPNEWKAGNSERSSGWLLRKVRLRHCWLTGVLAAVRIPPKLLFEDLWP
jgi:hypothetical protein